LDCSFDGSLQGSGLGSSKRHAKEGAQHLFIKVILYLARDGDFFDWY
jgi:hypothetical protein